MARVPPVVEYLPVQGPAYLIAWQQDPADMTWWAYLLWLEMRGDQMFGKEARVISGDVRKIPGQDYSGVPSGRLIRSRPTDLTDPRDPEYLRPAEERAAMEQRPVPEEPDF